MAAYGPVVPKIVANNIGFSIDYRESVSAAIAYYLWENQRGGGVASWFPGEEKGNSVGAIDVAGL